MHIGGRHRYSFGETGARRAQFQRRSLLLTVAIVLFGTSASHSVVLRKPLEANVYALNRGGTDLRLEYKLPAGASAETFLRKYLSRPEEWRKYVGGTAPVAIPFDRLKPEVQRTLLLTIFEEDYVTEKGWWHTGGGGPEEGTETVSRLCRWLTGSEANAAAVMRANGIESIRIEKGQKILIPAKYLRPVMKSVTRVSDPEVEGKGEEGPIDLESARRALSYGKDEEGEYAAYRMQQGDALYTSVVVRFTDFRDNASIQNACKRIQRRSHIRDVRAIRPGTQVLIPLELLSDRFKPEGSIDRRRYEAAIEEADRLRGKVKSKDLRGVVVVLDPGHGGRDHGAENHSLYEDELNYDVACRVKRLLETETEAKVYMTLVDTIHGFTPSDRSRFVPETHEELLTTPRYDNGYWRVSANLRAYLANDVFEKETKNGTDHDKVVFTSFHCDALFNESMRGAMIYIPSAKHRKDVESPHRKLSTYNRYKESAKGKRNVTTTASERKRDEALSRNFAATLMDTLGEHRIKRHDKSANIRSVIRRDGGAVYVPAVLRMNKIPTKVLVEAANMTNATDRSRLADPWWREQFAKAYVSALKTYFGS